VHEVRQQDQRRFERRSSQQALDDRGMRCEDCGTLWYSAVAEIAAAWARCIRCGGSLHVERRSGEDRRRARVALGEVA